MHNALGKVPRARGASEISIEQHDEKTDHSTNGAREARLGQMTAPLSWVGGQPLGRYVGQLLDIKLTYIYLHICISEYFTGFVIHVTG